MRILLIGHTYVAAENQKRLWALAGEPGVELTLIAPPRWRDGLGELRLHRPAAAPFEVRAVPAVWVGHEQFYWYRSFGLDLRRLRPDVLCVEQGAGSLVYAQSLLYRNRYAPRAKAVFFTWWNRPYRARWPLRAVERFNLRQSQGGVAGNVPARSQAAPLDPHGERRRRRARPRQGGRWRHRGQHHPPGDVGGASGRGGLGELFLYVADSKLCTRETLKHIHEHGGRFLTVLPRTRKEDALFKAWLQTHTPAWEEVARKPDPRWEDGPPDVFRAIASPIPDADGFRLFWYDSSHQLERDAQARRAALQRAWKALEALAAKLQGPRPRFRTQAAVAEAVDQILATTGAGRWVAYQVVTVEEAVFHQETRGRPGQNTRWRRRLKRRFRLTWDRRDAEIAYDARTDGRFPLLTNDPVLTAAEILDAYKTKQPWILEIFGPLQRHLLCNADRVVQRFDPELTELQRKLLAFLGISPKVFMNV